MPLATKKIIDMYGKKQILYKVEKVRQIMKQNKISLPMSQVAIKFAACHPAITLTIPGINKLRYARTNLMANNINLSDKFLAKLQDIEDLKKII